MNNNQEKEQLVSEENLTTESSYFDDIRHYRDDEVPGAIEGIINNDSIINSVTKYIFRKYPSWLVKLCFPILKGILKSKLRKVKTIHDVQVYVAAFMNGIIKKQTDGFIHTGFDKLDPKKGYLFISNHRDISLDPAFLNMALFGNNIDTVKIAIGDNLLKMPEATDLMKLHKSFIVKRSLTNVKDKIKAFSKLSQYIGLAIKENKNVWIAQREGRAKDGNDATEEAILKMFYMYGKKQGLSFKDYIKSLNIIPVSITYEYDPGDEAKAKELYEKEHNGSYVKGEMEDIKSIVDGILGYKGRVHFAAGDPLTGDYENAKELAHAIDKFIYEHYEIFPSTLLAAGITDGVTAEQKEFFEKRIANMKPEYRDYALRMYAAPYINQQKSLKNEI